MIELILLNSNHVTRRFISLGTAIVVIAGFSKKDEFHVKQIEISAGSGFGRGTGAVRCIRPE
jgi:hypothetical protein